MEIDRNPQEAARRMIKDGVPLQKVARMTGLDMEAVQAIARDLLCPSVLPESVPTGKFSSHGWVVEQRVPTVSR